MKRLDEDPIDRWRDRSDAISKHYGNVGDATCGVFNVPCASGRLHVVASSGGGWEHVSVSLRNRCPHWDEMEYIKRQFFRDDETAVQFHVPPSRHINVHPFCLHLWRPLDAALPLPPAWMIA